MDHRQLIYTTLLVIGIFSHSIVQAQSESIRVTIDGKDRSDNKELKISGESKMKIITDDASIEIQNLKITLARGVRAIEIRKFKDKEIDLAPFMRKARIGDRMILEIKFVNKGHSEKPTTKVMSIPVI